MNGFFFRVPACFLAVSISTDKSSGNPHTAQNPREEAPLEFAEGTTADGRSMHAVSRRQGPILGLLMGSLVSFTTDFIGLSLWEVLTMLDTPALLILFYFLLDFAIPKLKTVQN